MYCPKCGQELDANNVCTNPSCPTNSQSNYSNNMNFNNNQYANNQFNNDNQFNKQYNANQYNEFGDDYLGITPNDMMDFIGDKNTEYYMEKWTRYQANNNFISWNWPAFLFGFIWFAYRKMYNWMGILIGISIVTDIIFEGIFDLSGVNTLLGLVINVACGLLANQIYIKESCKKITAIKNSFYNMGIEDISLRLRSKGGITWAPVIVILVIFGVILVLGVVFFSLAFSFLSGSALY